MPDPVSPPACYSTRVDEALRFVADAFRHRVRKGTSVPYLSHLLAVMVIVAEHGGDEDQMVAALLHDYLEDIDGATPEKVRQLFGERVVRLVEGLSDSTVHPKPPWEERKRAYIANLRREPAELKLVSAADKLHNASSIRRDFRTHGPAVFERFTASREQTLWYYGEVVNALADGWAHPLLEDLVAEVALLRRETG